MMLSLTYIEGPGLSSNGFFPLLLIGIRGFPVVISLLKVGERQGRGLTSILWNGGYPSSGFPRAAIEAFAVFLW